MNESVPRQEFCIALRRWKALGVGKRILPQLNQLSPQNPALACATVRAGSAIGQDRWRATLAKCRVRAV